jgi:hypothetical protein
MNPIPRRASRGDAETAENQTPPPSDPLLRASASPREIGGRPLTAWLVPLLLFPLLPGCSSTSPRTPAPSPSADAIREINLLVMPTALNLDGQPGPDAVAVKIFAASATHAQAIPIRDGLLEIAAYSDTLPVDPSVPATPFHLWRFTSAELARHASTTLLGTAYNLTLSWSPKTLTGNRLTLVARHLPPDGTPVSSAPGFVATAVL